MARATCPKAVTFMVATDSQASWNRLRQSDWGGISHAFEPEDHYRRRDLRADAIRHHFRAGNKSRRKSD